MTRQVTPRAAKVGPGAPAVASHTAQLVPGAAAHRTYPSPLPGLDKRLASCRACFRSCTRSNPAGALTLQAAGRPPSRIRQSCFRSCWGPALRSQMACPHSHRRSGHGSLKGSLWRCMSCCRSALQRPARPASQGLTRELRSGSRS